MLRSLFQFIAVSSLRTVGIALMVFLLLASPGFAIGPGGGGSGVGGETLGGGSADTPEINPSAAIGVLTLLVGGTLILTDRLRRRYV